MRGVVIYSKHGIQKAATVAAAYLILKGGVNTETSIKIMKSKELNKIIDKHKKNDFSELICKDCDQTVHDDTVLVYKSNPQRQVGMENSSLYQWKDNIMA